jgi:hypothetical protein
VRALDARRMSAIQQGVTRDPMRVFANNADRRSAASRPSSHKHVLA